MNSENSVACVIGTRRRFLRLVVTFAVASFLGCDDRHQGFDTKMLDEGTRGREITTLASIDRSAVEWEYVCILWPYENKIRQNTQEADAVNLALRRADYVGDEGRWALVFVGGREEVRIEIISRSHVIDVASESVVSLQVTPPTFEPQRCVKTDQAALFRFGFRDYAYIALGRIGRD